VAHAGWETQEPGIITSRTDVLDAWYFEDYLRAPNGKKRLPSAPGRPQMASTPLMTLITGITDSGIATAPSIIATLLSGDITAQRRMAQHSRDVCLGSGGGTIERTITIPIPTLDDADGYSSGGHARGVAIECNGKAAAAHISGQKVTSLGDQKCGVGTRADAGATHPAAPETQNQEISLARSRVVGRVVNVEPTTDAQRRNCGCRLEDA